MTSAESSMHDLDLGVDVIHRLLPHRPPFLFVDRVVSFGATARGPIVRAARLISSSDPAFVGHFPGLHLWPGVLTIEAMGQASQLAETLGYIVERFEREGASAEDAMRALKALERVHRMERGPATRAAQQFEALLAAEKPRIGLSAAVDVRFSEPVFAGSRLDLEAVRTHVSGAVRRYDVSAKVEGRIVAKGSMTASIVEPEP